MPTLVVFCKRPKFRQGKQRLAADIGAEAAYLIACELLNCALEDAESWPGNVVIAISKSEDLDWAKQLLDSQHMVLDQSPLGPEGANTSHVETENLGQRINKIDRILRSQGHRHLAFIGTDAPMLSRQHYEHTIEQLKHFDVVLSEADDGGVGIMANSAPWPNLAHLPWSTNTLCSELSKLCQQHEYTLGWVDESFDVDVLPDVAKLRAHIKEDRRPARQNLLKLLDTLDASLKQHAINQAHSDTNAKDQKYA